LKILAANGSELFGVYIYAA